MQLQNITLVVLRRTRKGGLEVASVIANPHVAVKDGTAVIGPLARRLMTVKEVAQRDGLSLNKAAARRREEPLKCLSDFPGQQPVESLG